MKLICCVLFCFFGFGGVLVLKVFLFFFFRLFWFVELCLFIVGVIVLGFGCMLLD